MCTYIHSKTIHALGESFPTTPSSIVSLLHSSYVVQFLVFMCNAVDYRVHFHVISGSILMYQMLHFNTSSILVIDYIVQCVWMRICCTTSEPEYKLLLPQSSVVNMPVHTSFELVYISLPCFRLPKRFGCAKVRQ